MAQAAVAAVPAVVGAGASASSGKKGNNAAQKAANQQFQMQQQLFNTGMQAWQPAASYWQALLSGDPTKMAGAVGPTADVIRGQGQASAGQLAATTPAGGEANLAQQQNQMGTYSQIARLTAGVQPQAAQQLGQMAGIPMQISAPNVGSGLKFDTHQQELQGQSKGALGTGLGRIAVGGKGSGGGGNKKGRSGGGTPTSGGDAGNFPGA